MDRTCGECGAGAARLRKGRCDACYMRQYRRPRVETVADLRDRLAPAHVPERRTGRRARPALAPVVPSFDPSID
jgi:hypothetical protein